MSGSRIGKILLTVVALAAVGGGLLLWKAHEENRKLALQAEKAKAAAQKARAEGAAAETAAREGAKAKEAEARTAEARRKTSESDRARAADELAAKKEAAEAARVKLEAEKAETAKAEAQKAAAEAETRKAEAQKAAAEASRAEQEKKAAAEALALGRAEEERKKADAEYATAAAVKRAAEAAQEKSENERKAAEANAAAEHDRKLRMYQRAGTSRAELLALKRAEKLLALEEAGALETPESASEPAPEPVARTEEASLAKTNATLAVKWPEEKPSAEDARLSAVTDARDEKASARATKRARACIRSFIALADAAEADGRAADAAYHRASILALVPDYVKVFADSIVEAHGAKREEDARKLAGDLFKIVPAWERTDVVMLLLDRDDAYFAELLAGRVDKKTYVSAFRKCYDRARRDIDSEGENGRDPRAEKMQRIQELLARTVPDYESIYEWSGRYGGAKDE